jgi:GNAT superfamily N-acetyltransferase
MTSPTTIRIRDAAIEDAIPLERLLDQLGYRVSPEEVVKRLLRLRDFGSAIARVAEVDGRVAGLVTCHVFPTIHSPGPVALLTTLVVDEELGRRGVGRALTASAEEWAGARGASRIVVTSATHREPAHAFYEGIGYERTGVRFGRKLNDP